MEVISLKMDAEMLKNIDAVLKKHNYGTRTEFIRDSIRVKLSSLNKEEALAEFAKSRGSSKTKTSWKKYRQIRESITPDDLKDFKFNL